MKRKLSPFGELMVNSTKITYNWAKGPGARMAVQGGKFVGRQAKSVVHWAKEQGQGGGIGRARYGGLRGRVFGKKKMFED